jgi:hypothetical protein
MSLADFFGVGRQTAQQAVVAAVQPEPFEKKLYKDLDELAVYMRSNGGTIPTAVYSQVRQIDDILRPLLAFITANGCSPEQEHLLTSMITNYIPTPLKTFVSLPKADRADNGNPARLLKEQFDTMLEKVADLAELVRTGALNELAIHADFIDNRFSGV